MTIEIEYAETIIVWVHYRDKWNWYVTDKELWFLDLIKYEQAFIDAGYELHNQGDFSDRFDIPIVNRQTAADFIEHIEEFKVTTNQLSKFLLKEPNKEEIDKYKPVLFVDFDTETLISSFPEPASYEEYVPENWESVYKDFLEDVPTNERYWVIGGKSYF
ncbi:hypothetical protein [Metabacillus bambusae]|uniref:Group-specific protein n=1 Tax=Metabacillus bambusae TaxID=2795218 RepID=A0ABS3N484_9BACI|nr:hypothetical protein [Metabacillus bambusae]MBO1512693.1 hypothetical protein [Metabacillus bambusae]